MDTVFFKLSLSVRVAEAPCKTKLTVPFEQLVEWAAELGYQAVCLRPSVVGVHSPPEQWEQVRRTLEQYGLSVSMVTADFDVPLNNERGPRALRKIGPTLELAQTLGADLVRVCLKKDEDIEYARAAAEQAAQHGIRLAHQSHTCSLFETVEGSLKTLRAIDRSNFGIIYEPANLVLCGQPYGVDTLKAFRPYLFNVYVQNLVVEPEGPVPWETWCRGAVRFRRLALWEPGGVDFACVLDGLRQVGYNGYVTVHQPAENGGSPYEAAKRSAEFLRQLAEEIGPKGTAV